MKRLLVIGAMSDARNISKDAKDRGAYVINFRNGFYAEDNPYADEVYELDIFDPEAVYAKAKELNVDGILANADLYMPVASEVGSRLGLLVNDLEAIKICRSKYRFRELAFKCGIFAPKCVRIKSPDELEEGISKLSYPIIMKPESGNSSFGVRRFEAFDKDAMAKAVAHCLKFPGCEAVVVEEFVEAEGNRTIEAEVFLHRGKFVWGGIFSCTRSPISSTLAMTEVAPPEITESHLKEFMRVTEKILNAMGATFGEFNVEAFVTKEGRMFIIEINPRQGGDCLPWMSYLHSSVDMSRLVVDCALGDDRYFEEVLSASRTNNAIMCYDVYATHKGTYAGVKIRDGFPGKILLVNKYKKPGDSVNKAQHFGDRMEAFIIKFDTVEEMRSVRDSMDDYISPIILPRRWYHKLSLYRWIKWGYKA